MTGHVDPTKEATHLRRVLEKQPACLMRVALDGVLLAVNDAALGLLAAHTLEQALGRSLTEWMAPDQRGGWSDFATLVSSGGPASFECDFKAPAGGYRATLFHGVPLLDHPDGVGSMILSARDVFDRRRLEAALHARDSGGISTEAEPVVPCEAADGGHDRIQALEAALSSARTHEQQLAAGHAAERARFERTLKDLQDIAERRLLELLAKEKELLQQRDGTTDVGRTFAGLARSVGDRARRLLAERGIDPAGQIDVQLLLADVTHMEALAQHVAEVDPQHGAGAAPLAPAGFQE